MGAKWDKTKKVWGWVTTIGKTDEALNRLIRGQEKTALLEADKLTKEANTIASTIEERMNKVLNALRAVTAIGDGQIFRERCNALHNVVATMVPLIRTEHAVADKLRIVETQLRGFDRYEAKDWKQILVCVKRIGRYTGHFGTTGGLNAHKMASGLNPAKKAQYSVMENRAKELEKVMGQIIKRKDVLLKELETLNKDFETLVRDTETNLKSILTALSSGERARLTRALEGAQNTVGILAKENLIEHKAERIIIQLEGLDLNLLKDIELEQKIDAEFGHIIA